MRAVLWLSLLSLLVACRGSVLTGVPGPGLTEPPSDAGAPPPNPDAGTDGGVDAGTSPPPGFHSILGYGQTIGGDGRALDGPVIQQILDAHPADQIFFPPGDYLLDNHGFNSFGLDFNGFSGAIQLAAGARFVCNTDDRMSSGQCLNIRNSTGPRFIDLDVTYVDAATLPLPRQSCSANNAILVIDSAQVSFTGLTIETSPGVGFWATNSEHVSVATARVTRTSADGIHFENVLDASVSDYTSDGTGDDGLAVTNIAQSNPNCGFTATRIHIHHSLARGIVVVGGCDATVTDFDITTTTDPGISVSQDESIQSRRSTHVQYSQGQVTGAGTYCGEIAASDDVTLDSIQCTAPGNDGFFLYSGATQATVSHSTVTDAGNGGFRASGVTGAAFTDDQSSNSATQGFAVQSSTSVTLARDTTTGAGGYGFYHDASGGLTESDLVATDSARVANDNRAWWAENMTGAVGVDGLTVNDDQSPATGYVVGDDNDGSLSIQVTGLRFTLANGTPSVVRGSSDAVYTLAP